jgi:hypothetical protein
MRWKIVVLVLLFCVVTVSAKDECWRNLNWPCSCPPPVTLPGSIPKVVSCWIAGDRCIGITPTDNSLWRKYDCPPSSKGPPVGWGSYATHYSIVYSVVDLQYNKTRSDVRRWLFEAALWHG